MWGYNWGYENNKTTRKYLIKRQDTTPIVKIPNAQLVNLNSILKKYVIVEARSMPGGRGVVGWMDLQ